MHRKTLIYLSSLLIWSSILYAQKPLQYTVKVQMHMVPIYATDQKGRPVFDIKKQEIELFVDGKPVDFNLLRYDFSTITEKSKHSIKSFKEINKRENRHNRIVFMIIDAMYNSKIGIKRSKSMARRIIKESSPGDFFIIMENTNSRGLRYLAGPDRNVKKLHQHISEITDFPEKYSPNLFSLQGYDAASERIMANDPIQLTMLQLQHKVFLEQRRYINNIKSFSQSLGRLKYVLKTIALPKSVIIFSEGIAKGAFKERGDRRSTLLFKILRNSIRSISSTGSIVNTINPQLRDPFKEKVAPMDSGDMSLKIVANEGGGRYFSSPTTEDMVENFKDSTSAYYELAFSQENQRNQRKNIKIICRRRGVKISTLKRVEKRKTYSELDKIEKQMFALNIVFNSRWLGQMDEAKETDYRLLKTEGVSHSLVHILEVKIPKRMQNKKGDIYLIQIDISRQKNNIQVNSRILHSREKLRIKISKNLQNHFVIVDPQTSFSVYGNSGWDSENWRTSFLKNKISDDYHIPNTATLMKINAGILSAATGIKGNHLKLNGVTIYQEPGELEFQRIYKTNFEDIVVLRASSGAAGSSNFSYRLVIFKSNGAYHISSSYGREPGQVTSENGSVLVKGQPIRVIKKGKTSLIQKDFYSFFYRFKADEEFQLSHISFPFHRKSYDPATGKLLNILKIPRSDWEFTPFEDNPSFTWSEPEVSKHQAIIYLTGKQVKIGIIFKKENGRWILVRSENRSK